MPNFIRQFIPGTTIWIGCFVVIVLGAIVALAAVTAPKQAGTDQKDPEKVNTLESVQVLDLKDYDYLGVAEDDTVVIYSKAGEELVINLAHLKWQAPAWSPNGEMLTLIGRPGAILVNDIYLFTAVDKRWTQITNYQSADSGVTGYAWLDDNFVIYTQGQGDNAWVHRYDVRNGETRKMFQTASDLVQLDLEHQHIITRRNLSAGTRPSYRYFVWDFAGSKLATIDSGLVSDTYQLTDMISGRNADEFLSYGLVGIEPKAYLFDTGAAQVQGEQVFIPSQLVNPSADESETELAQEDFEETPAVAQALKVRPICALDKNLYYIYYYADQNQQLIIGTANPDNSNYSDLVTIADGRSLILDIDFATCAQGNLLVPINSVLKQDNQRNWYLIVDGKAEKITALEGFSEVVGK